MTPPLQLPAHDCYPEAAGSICSEEARAELDRFVRKAREVSTGD